MAIGKLVEKVNLCNLNIAIYQDKSMTLGHSFDIKPIIIGYKTQIEKNKLIQKIKWFDFYLYNKYNFILIC